MDFTNRNPHAQSGANTPAPGTAASPAHHNGQHADGGNGKKSKGEKVNRWLTYSPIILLYAVTILIIAVLLYINFGGKDNAAKFVQQNKLQAVFLNVSGTNGGQVYFGHITNLSKDYLRLNNVFYIQSQQVKNGKQTQQQYNLVKLGCELHGPEDAMLINRQNVIFWENLKSNGQVTQKVNQYYKKHPNGQKCNSQKGVNQKTTSAAKQQPASSQKNPGQQNAPSNADNNSKDQNTSKKP
jgi:hypothetical protein